MKGPGLIPQSPLLLHSTFDLENKHRANLKFIGIKDHLF